MAKKPTRKKAAKKAGKRPQKKRSAAPKARPKVQKAKKRPASRTPAKTRTAKRPAPKAKPASTKRSAGAASGAGSPRKAPGLDRERKRLRDLEETVPTPPSSLNPDRLHPSAARSGRAAFKQARRAHTETSPQLTGGDVDADWEDAYAVGDEAPGGDNPTPDQDRVDDIGRALGIEYADNEELKAVDKIAERDKHRWELDPASAEDYPDHDED